MIIHISGPPGSGKTTVGNRLKIKYKDKIFVKDLDDLFGEFMETNKITFNPSNYQTHIDNYIASHKTKIIVFVGLNQEHITNTVYNIQSNYNFFIDLPIEINLERHFIREINGWLKWMEGRDKHILFSQILENQTQVIKDLSKPFDISKQKKFIKSFNKTYKKQNYEFADVAVIYKKVTKLINKNLSV